MRCKFLVGAGLGFAITISAQAQQTDAAREAMLARAKAVEISAAWTPPPGEPLTHFTVAYAKLMCSAVFVSGMDPDFARQTLGDNNALAAIGLRAKVRRAGYRPRAA